MIKIGLMPHENTFHIVDESTGRSLCNMVSVDEESARDVKSGALFKETRSVESLSDLDDHLRVCKHCDKKRKRPTYE